MHPIESSERPSPAIAAPASSPAPADAGQGVGTIFPRDQSAIDAIPVLRKMFQRRKDGSLESEALLTAIVEIQMSLSARGIQA